LPNIRTYLIRTFSNLFFSIFLPILGIATMILFIRIAKITEVIQMSGSEMLMMYAYFLPTILFYTLPIAFFAALALALARLSNDFENIVLFSFGIAPRQILQVFIPVTAAFTALLLLLSLVVVPITKQLIKSFVNYKSVHAVLNIEPSKFGQKFGPWLVFLESKDPKSGMLHHIILFNPAKPNEEQVLVADEADFIQKNGVLGLNLRHGTAYQVAPDKIDQIDFQTMTIYRSVSSKPFTYRNVGAYWQAAKDDRKRRKDLLIFISVSLFPVVALFFAFGFGILHPRYDRNHTYVTIFGVTVLYYGFVSALAKLSVGGTLLFFLLFTGLAAYLFHRRIERRF